MAEGTYGKRMMWFDGAQAAIVRLMVQAQEKRTQERRR